MSKKTSLLFIVKVTGNTTSLTEYVVAKTKESAEEKVKLFYPYNAVRVVEELGEVIL